MNAAAANFRGGDTRRVAQRPSGPSPGMRMPSNPPFQFQYAPRFLQSIHPQDPFQEFAEFFSSSDDGTTPIPTRILEQSNRLHVPKISASKTNLPNPSPRPTELPYLPFDELIGYNLPEEAAEGLEILFRGRLEPGPQYETRKQVLAEVRLSSGQVFQGKGRTKEEAKNSAAWDALLYLKSVNN